MEAIRKNVLGGRCSDIIQNNGYHFWPAIIDCIRRGCPVLARGEDNSKNGHAFVIDGYATPLWFEFYHFNMGWGMNPGSRFWGRGSNYNNNMAAITDIDLDN